MLEWLKTPSGAYNLTLIIALISWLVTGVGIIAGFHLNKVHEIKTLRDKEQVESRLESTKQKLFKLEEEAKPKPLKERVLSFLNQLDKRIIPDVQNGQFEFRLMLTYAQAAELQALDQEDSANDYITVLPNTNMIMNEPGKAGQFIFRVGTKLIE